MAGYAELAVVARRSSRWPAAALWALARSIARPLADVADTLDAMACAELGSAPPLAVNRSEVAHLTAAADRLAEVLGERQRRELVHSDLDRTWQASRRVNLSSLAVKSRRRPNSASSRSSMAPRRCSCKAEDMTAALEAVRAAFDETAAPPKVRAP